MNNYYTTLPITIYQTCPKCHHMQFNGSMHVILIIIAFFLLKKKIQKRKLIVMLTFQLLYS